MIGELIVDIIHILIMDLNLVLLMFNILMVAYCFLGRKVSFSRKLFWASGVIFILDGIIRVLYVRYLDSSEQELIATFMNETETAAQIERLEAILQVVSLASTVVIYIAVFFIFLMAYREKRIRRAVESLVCYILIQMYIDEMLMYFIIFIDNMNIDSENVLYYMNNSDRSIYILSGGNFLIQVITALILYFGYVKKKKVCIMRVRDRVLFVVWMLLLVTVPNVPIDEMINGQRENAVRYLCILFGVMIILTGVIAPVIFVMRTTGRALKEQNEVQQKYLEAELQYIDQYKKSQQQTRAFRHDILNHLSLTAMLLDEGKGEEAKEHIRELIGDVQTFSQQFATGDEMLDCIISMKAEKMKNMEIAFTAQGVAEGGLHMKPMDICSIFANALDNAIEASMKSKEPSVCLKIKHTKQFMMFEIENSVAEKVNVDKLLSGERYTSKNAKESHGFGFENLRRCVENNDGEVRAKCDEKQFILSILLPKAAM